MNSTLYSFADIFNSFIVCGEEKIKLNKIVIPIIQRDYAQGRESLDIQRVRERFLSSLYDAVTKKPVVLDFVYGDIDESGIMTPLDGQQRLTTLFLLHYYAAEKGGISEEKSRFLRNFSYETRYSARDFCKELVEHKPSFEKNISEEIIDMAWFPLEWKKDSTINSMLVMLDAIDKKFCDVENLWEKLENGAVRFYFLAIKDMGLTDELYIKMNSRGKPLTPFEHFKAEFERELGLIDASVAERIVKKIDREWTDLLWKYRNSGEGNYSDNITDDEFLRYFNFVCDMICYKKGELPRTSDEFELLQCYFSHDNENAVENVRILEESFDCWCDIKGFDNPTEFLESFMSYEHEEGKIIVNKSRYELNIFKNYIHSYRKPGIRIVVGRSVLLYAIVFYLRNQNMIGYDDFVRRIRIVNNLIQNSVDEVAERRGGNRLPAILCQVENIIMNGSIDKGIEANFNANQINEEAEKIEFLELYPQKAEELFELEDHKLLCGQIGILGIENFGYNRRFKSLFECSYDKIDCALMAIDNYGQKERRGYKYQYGSCKFDSSWENLFHKSSNSGFDTTKATLIRLLETNETFTDEILDNIADDFIKSCERNKRYPWRYYYIKYSSYRPGKYGKLRKDNINDNYMFLVMTTETMVSQNAYMPYLYEVDKKRLSREHFGERLLYDKGYVICTDTSFVLKNYDDEVIDILEILQNTDGEDIEDRIVKLKDYAEKNLI